MVKDYHQDLLFFIEKLSSRSPFSLARFNDGEMHVLLNAFYYCNDFQFDPSIQEEEELCAVFSLRLREALKWKHPSYYVGIMCPHCFHPWGHVRMKLMSQQTEEQLTWASVFSNTNFFDFIDLFLPELSHRKDIYLIAHEKAQTHTLPFKLQDFFPVTSNVWKLDPLEIVRPIKEKIRNERIKNALFLFCSGPSTAIYVQELCAFDAENSYIDLGSSLDLWLFKTASRQYQYASPKDSCQWSA